MHATGAKLSDWSLFMVLHNHVKMLDSIEAPSKHALFLVETAKH